MKKVIKQIGLYFLVFSLAQATAQSPGGGSPFDFLDSSDAPAAFSSQAVSDAETFINQKGWERGRPLPDGRFVAVGTADILGDPSSPNFQLRRRNAFTQAMLDAKRQIAQYYAQSVARSVSFSYGEGDSRAREAFEVSSPGGSNEHLSLIEKAKMLIGAELDAALRSRGVEPNTRQAEAVAEELLDPLNRSQLRDRIERMAEATVGALVVSKIFEDTGTMAVVATYSPATKQLASAMMGQGAAPRVRPRAESQSVGQWLTELSIADLYPTYGVQLTSDEEGNLILLSYGQAMARTESQMSMRNALMAAESDADGYIRSFVGEAVAFSGNQENLELAEEFDDGRLESLVERIQENSINTIASGLSIPGIGTARTWHTRDTRSGAYIVGVVRRWDFASAVTAIQEGRDFQRTGAGAGGAGITAPSRSGSPAQEAGSSREAVAVDPSGERYRHESRASEDF
jgi:hypothetical protein